MYLHWLRKGTKKAMKNTSCKTSRWRQLKALLNNLEPLEFLQQIEQQPEALVIDVRTDAEVQTGMLNRAIHFNYLDYDFWDRMEELDREKTYFVYCRSGRRSIRTCTLMKNAGFRNVFNLDGGLNLLEQVIPDQVPHLVAKNHSGQ
jgi:rhodanese-related sulfurtransferase